MHIMTTTSNKMMGSHGNDDWRSSSPAVQAVAQGIKRALPINPPFVFRGSNLIPNPNPNPNLFHHSSNPVPPNSPNTDTSPPSRRRQNIISRGDGSPVKNMDIDDFLAAHQIASVPVRVMTYENQEGQLKKKYISLGGKDDLALKFRYGQNIFNGDAEAVNHLRHVQQLFNEKRQMLLRKYGQTLRGAMDTNRVFVIDVDRKEQEQTPVIQDLMATSPYYRSVSKGLPKIFVKVVGQLIATKNVPLVKSANPDDKSAAVELQKGQWSFYNYNQTVENVDGGIRELTVDELRSMFPDFPSTNELELVRAGGFAPSDPQDRGVQGGRSSPTDDSLKDCPLNPNVYTLGMLVSLLRPTRADDRRSWLSVAYTLKWYLGDGGWEIFKQFSEQSPKFRPVEDKYMYDNLVASGISNINSLRKMAFYDNPENYVSSFPEDVAAKEKHLIFKLGTKKTTNISHGAIVDIFELTEEADMFRYCGLSKTWFSVKENDTWVRHAEPILNAIREFTASLVEDKFKGELDKDDAKKFVKQLEKAHTKAFVDGVLYFLKGRFLHDHFLDKLDTNGRIVAFNDCVYDLDLKDFRATEPSDNIMTTVGYKRPYVETAIQEEIKMFMRSLFDTEEKTEYLWLVLASSLFEGNRQQEFYVLTGAGSNGKSLLMALMNKALGEYNGDISYASLTARRKSENAFSDWVKTRPMRFVKCLEPDAKSMIQGNVIKKITGGDVMTERELHRNTVSWKPLFVFYLIANEVPRFDHIDPAVERRLRFLHFPFQFKYREQMGTDWDDTIHRERDDDLAQRLENDDRYGQQFMLMLIDKFVSQFEGNDHAKVLSHIPKDFYDKQMEYQRQNNTVATFIADRYDILNWQTLSTAEKTQYALQIDTIYTAYKGWAQSAIIRTTDKNMTREQFANNLSKVPGIDVARYRPSEVRYTLRLRSMFGGGAYTEGFTP